MKEQYPVLDNRPINQWKVTELKDELKRRGLPVKGLKNDLIKRLAEAIGNEGGDSEEDSSDAAGTEIAPDNSERPDIGKPVENDNDIAGVNIDSGPNLTREGKSQVEEPTNNTVVIDDSSKIAQIDVQEEEAVGNTINVGDLPAAETGKEDFQEEKAVGKRVDVDDGRAEIGQGEVEKENGGTDSLRLVPKKQVVILQTLAIDGKTERENMGQLHKQSQVSPNDDIVVAERAVIEVPEGATDRVNGVKETLAAASESPMENNGNKMDSELSESLQRDVVLNKLAPNDHLHVPVETDKGKAEEEISGTDSFRPVTEESVLVTCIESSTLVDETVVIENSPVDEDSKRNKIEPMQEHSEISPTHDVVFAEKTVIEVPVETINLENGTGGTTAASKKCMENNGSKMATEPSEPLQKDVLLTKQAPNNQVHEVSPNVGDQVKFESISTNSLSVSEKNELMDDTAAANVHLKIDAVKEEMVQLPSGGFPDDGNFHPTEDEKSFPNQDISEKTDVKISEFMDSDNIISGDVGSSVISKVEQNKVEDHISESFENKTIDLVHKATELTDLSGPNQKDGNYSAGLGLLSEKMETYAKEIELIAEMKPQGQDPSEGTQIEDEGTFEKVNVDPSSTDDSMDEDTLEAKQLVSNLKSSEVANIESAKLPSKKYETVDAVGCDASSLQKMEMSSQRTGSTASPGKRKFQDEVATNNNETPKRQRNWNSSTLTTGESGSSSRSFSAGNKLLSPKTVLKHNIIKADSTLDAPKERTVPPSQKSPTNSLRIDHFLRPFTLKAVQQLLSQTGKVCTFWMDQIKTHCYVTYSSVEEAIETRNSVYNLQWPQNGGRLLVAEFVDPEDVKLRVEAPSQPTAPPAGINPTATKSRSPISPPRENVLKQSVLPEAPLRQPPPPSDPPRTRDRLPVPPPPRDETEEPPIVTLDVLFRKTRATPRIYYLPLTDEEVATKLSKKRRG